MADFTIKKDSLIEPMRLTLKDALGAAVNLTGATVKFRMRLIGSAVLKVDRAMTLDSAAAGQVSHAWQTDETDTAGRYVGEVYGTMADGKPFRFPADGYLSVLVPEDLA